MSLKDEQNIRPTEYDDEIMREICLEVAQNSASLADLCDKNPHWPNIETIKQWLRQYREFAELFFEGKSLFEKKQEKEKKEITYVKKNRTTI